MSTTLYAEIVVAHRCGAPLRTKPVAIDGRGSGLTFLPVHYCFRCGVYMINGQDVADEKEVGKRVQEFFDSGTFVHVPESYEG